ncbi:hypothetical protein [Arcobacter sp. LA11]|uniref:hypothetical protein n=1 Tax=Arcobacter sp. LA11 TaxID=1898176 RepID=UPI000934BBEA|nr:hypothetical protein [Arcobacter sp. LA11]
MNLKIYIILLIISNYLIAECLNKQEKEIILSDDYFLQRNYIQCNKQSTSLDKYICSNPNLLLMFNYYTMVHIDSRMRYFKYFNFNEFREIAMENFRKDNINPNHLCFNLKRATSILLYSDSLYNMIKINDIEYIIQKNKDGIVLTNREGYKIYLGKTCDTLDSKGNKGIWSRISNKYLIKLGKKEFIFNSSKLSLKNYKCLK